jgi:regulator of replication initiation timing
MSTSPSRAELEAMTEGELIATVKDMQETVDNLETLVHVQIEKRKDLADTVENLVDRVDDLEAENERLRARLADSAHTPHEKLASLVEYAHNKRSSDAVVVLTPEEIAGSYGCSTRYAYQLIDDLPDEYAWLLSPETLRDSQYGTLEQETDSVPKRLGVDFEGVHTAPVPLNRFINGNSGNGGGN